MQVEKRLRSLLFVPGDSHRKIIKSQQIPADALVVDWEDAVAPQSKTEARKLTVELMRQRATLPMIVLRLNPVPSAAFQEDCAVLGQCPVDGIMLSKCQSAGDVCRLEEVLNRVPSLDKCRIYPLLESPAAILNAFSIAMASPRVAALAFGAEDFSAETGIVRTAGEIELLYARSSLVTQARAAGRDALDSPCLEFRRPRRIAAAARRARNLGFTGQMAIHPSQVKILNEVFSPSKREVKEARDVVAAASPRAGVFSIEGSMVDEAVLRRARRVLRLASQSGGGRKSTC
jgi:citrate lyase subunit beta / citryl-CoA lyase